jgi:hypothetical protein
MKAKEQAEGYVTDVEGKCSDVLVAPDSKKEEGKDCVTVREVMKGRMFVHR